MRQVLSRYGLTLLLLSVGIVLWLQREAPATQLYELTGSTMGTVYSIKLGELPASPSPETVAGEISGMLHRLDRELMSTYAPDSELSRFNRSEPGDDFAVSRELAEVMQLAGEISELTDGAFDVTVGPLVNRWGFGPTGPGAAAPIPDDAELAALLEGVGYHHLEVNLEPPALRKLAPVYVDLSGIAKGYAVDEVAGYLDSLAIDGYFVEIGGELRIKGSKPDGSTWVPAIERPLDTEPQVHEVFYSHGEAIAVAGSGDYRNYFQEDGIHYSHEIDPRSGRPISHGLAAVYVISDTAARADALATAFMVMGRDEAFRLASEQGIAAYFISKSPHNEGFEDSYTEPFTHYLQQPE